MKLTTICTMKDPIPNTMSKAPNVEMMNQGCIAGSSKWFNRRVTPIRPSTYIGMKTT